MDELLSSWARSLRARARSEATIDAYVTDLRSLDVWLRARGLSLVDATRRLLEEFLAELREQGKAPATIARRYRSFQQFFKWALDEDEIPADPMAKMRPPKVPVQPPPIIPTADLLKLLASCDTPRGGPGRAKPTSDKLTFENKRDRALILMLATTGIRSGELMGLTRESIDLNSSTFTVMGKGGRARIVALMPKPADALDKYLRARRRHARAALPALWLGDRGALTDSGLRQMLERRSDDAGIGHVHPHLFRHRFAHEAKSRGMTDGDLMSIAGWNSPQMLHRYGASAAAERARDAHRRLFGGD